MLFVNSALLGSGYYQLAGLLFSVTKLATDFQIWVAYNHLKFQPLLYNTIRYLTPVNFKLGFVVFLKHSSTHRTSGCWLSIQTRQTIQCRLILT